MFPTKAWSVFFAEIIVLNCDQQSEIVRFKWHKLLLLINIKLSEQNDNYYYLNIDKLRWMELNLSPIASYNSESDNSKNVHSDSSFSNEALPVDFNI